MPFIYSYSDSRTEPVDFHDFMAKFSRFSDDPSTADVDALNEKRARVQSLLQSQPNTKAVLEVRGSWGMNTKAFRQLKHICHY